MPAPFADFARFGRVASVVTAAAVVISPLVVPQLAAAKSGATLRAPVLTNQPVTPLVQHGGAPVTPKVREFPLLGVARQAREATSIRAAAGVVAAASRELVAVSVPRPVSGYGVVGVTWEGRKSFGAVYSVRTRIDSGWSPWQRLHGGGCPCAACTAGRIDGGHGPNAGSAEAIGARGGTDALAIGDVDAVQVRVSSPSGRVPRDLELAVVNPQSRAADRAVQTLSSDSAVREPSVSRSTSSRTMTIAAATRKAPRPAIFTRAQWGADERMRSGKPSYGAVRAAFVHHTVNANAYARAEVPAIIRGIYAYRTQSQGWSDIGYNFLVDRFGRIWEGRYGGMDRAVIGAHTYGYNHTAFAMSAIGNFDVTEPTSPMLDAYGDLFAWKLDLHGVAAKSTQTLEGKKFPAISGHRDAGQTACPGKYLHAKLSAIRTRAANAQAGTAPAPAPTPAPAPVPQTGPDARRNLHTDGYPDLVVRDAETDQMQVMAGDGGPGFADRRVFHRRAGLMGLITGVRDVTGDSRPDLLVRSDKSKIAHVRPGRPNGLFGPRISATGTKKFAGADLISGVGNMVAARQPDVIARDARTKQVWIYPGRRQGTWGAKRLLIRRAGRLSLIVGAGDLNGDRRPDLLARAGTDLLLYPGRGDGLVGKPRVVARNWDGKDLAVAGHDVTGDGRPDLVARDRATGRTWIYTVRSGGSIGPRFGGWNTWADLDRLTGVGDVAGNGTISLVGRTRGRQLVVLPALGTRWLQGPRPTTRSAAGADFMQVAGDWNDDGHVDVITRSADSGRVLLYPGSGDGSLGARVAMWGMWRDRTDLVATEDVTGDALPDLYARDPDGQVYVYPSDGSGGKAERRLAHSNLFATDMIVSAGYWNEDGNRDLIVRHAGNKQLYLVPGRTDGVLGRPVRLTGGFAPYDRIVGVGDFNDDGRPDLLARERSTGHLWLFAGTPSGLKSRQFVAADAGRYDLIG